MVTGDVRKHEVQSEILGETRPVVVWLPPQYAADDVTRFSALYLLDGQNLFDPETAFAGEWHVDETATDLVRRGSIEPLIIVGVYNAGERRVDEYTPSIDPAQRRGGGLKTFGAALVQEIKPWIDSQYRTLPGAESTGVGGSSLGGLAALQLGLWYPTTFSRLAIHSPAVWWNGREIIAAIDALPQAPSLRIWLDAGTAEAESVIPDLRALRAALHRKGWRRKSDLAYHEVRGAGHNEAAWAERVGPMLRFLFPAERQSPGLARAIWRLGQGWRRRL
jgi:predicted alpha/beta superfamily hydrolase